MSQKMKKVRVKAETAQTGKIHLTLTGRDPIAIADQTGRTVKLILGLRTAKRIRKALRVEIIGSRSGF